MPVDNKELSEAIINHNEGFGSLLSDKVQSTITKVFNESRFARSLSITAASLSTGMGMARLPAGWVFKQGLPDWFNNVYRSTLLYVHESGYFDSWADSLDMGYVMKGAMDRAAKAGNSGHMTLIPVNLNHLALMQGGEVVVLAMKKLFALNGSVETQYNKLTALVKQRDTVANKNKNVKDEEQAKSAIKEIDKVTGNIMKEAKKLETMLSREADKLSDDEVDTLSAFLEHAKNGIVTSTKGR